MSVNAIRHIRRMKGGSQSHLMLCDDGFLYVVKFQNNPQHIRVLANEMFATLLAGELGLSVPMCEVVAVSDSLIEESPDLYIEGAHTRCKCSGGLQFGSRHVAGLMPGQVMDVLPADVLLQVTNLNEYAGALAFDKWTCNKDSRQAVYSKRQRAARYSLAFIDQGYCLGGADWAFNDAPVIGRPDHTKFYRSVIGWQSFEPWLGNIESISREAIQSIALTVPPEWYCHDHKALDEVIAQLVDRRGKVRRLIEGYRGSDARPFPAWRSP